jgi:sirohydrochlorin cobaltochelatase
MMSDTVFVLIAHGSRDPAWAEPLVHLARSVGARLAFIEMGAPSIDEAVTGALAEGARTVWLLPLFMAVGRHVKRDIPASVAALRAAHPDRTIEILPPLGENPRFWEALHEIVRAQMGSAPESAPTAQAPAQALTQASGDGVTRSR